MGPWAKLTVPSALLSVVIWTASPSGAILTTVFSSGDAEIDSLQSTTDCGDTAGTAPTATIGRVGGKTTTNHRYLARFDLTAIPTGATITSATLALWVEAYTAPDAIPQFPIEVLRISNPDWQEATAKLTTARCSAAEANVRQWCADGGDVSPDDIAIWTATPATLASQAIDVTALVRRAVGAQGSSGLDAGGHVHLLLRAGADVSMSVARSIRIRTREQLATYQPALLINWTAGAPAGFTWLAFENQTTARLDSALLSPLDTEEKDLVVSDLDDDGDEDLVIVRKVPFGVAGRREDFVLLNQDGRLVKHSSLSHLSDARDVFAGDFDGDQDPDLVVATTCMDPPKFYRNLGGRCAGWGGFGSAMGDGGGAPDWRPTGYPAGLRFCAVWGGDVDLDGDMDLYLSNYDPGGGNQCVNPGTAHQTSDLDALLVNKINTAAGRFVDETSARLLGTGSNSLARVAFGTSVEIHDLDSGDAGVAPAIVKMSTLFNTTPWNSMGAYVLRNNGLGGFSHNAASDRLHVGGAPYMFTMGPLNSDQRLDAYVVDDFADKVKLATGATSYSTSTPSSGRTTGVGGNVKTADMDGDGDLDVGVADVDVQESITCVGGQSAEFALLRNSDGALDEPWNFANSQNFHQALGSVHDFAFLDVNRDGCLDLFLALCDGYRVFINRTPPCQRALLLGDQ